MSKVCLCLGCVGVPLNNLSIYLYLSLFQPVNFCVGVPQLFYLIYSFSIYQYIEDQLVRKTLKHIYLFLYKIVGYHTSDTKMLNALVDLDK